MGILSFPVPVPTAILWYLCSKSVLFFPTGWPHNKLLEKTLYLQVVDYDRFSRDDPIGELYIPLNEIDLSIFPTVWKYLQPCKDSRVSTPDHDLATNYYVCLVGKVIF